MKDIDNSRLETFQACPQLYDYRYNHEVGDVGLKFKADFSTHMIHHPVQQWFASGGKYKPNWMELVAKWQPSTEEMMKDKLGSYTAARAERLFKEFVEKSTIRGDLEVFEYIEHEKYKTKRISLVDKTEWGAKTDIVMYHKVEQCRYVWEIKASKWDYILTGLPFNRQVLGEFFVNDSCKIVVLFFSLSAKKNEPGVMFIELEPSESEIIQWRSEVQQSLEEVKRCEAYDFWPRRTAACKRFNQTCEFLDLCERGGMQNKDVRKEVLLMEKHDSLSYLTSDD